MKGKISNKIVYVLSLLIGIPLGYLYIPDNTSMLQCIWYPVIVSFFVICLIMILKGIFEEYIIRK